jgi:TRAP-type C4-dicarboxylate transport system permease small subunit
MFERVVYSLETVFTGIAMIMYVALMLLGTFDVLGRYLFNHPIWGTYEISQMLMAGIVLFGWAYTQRMRAHVRVELFLSRYPRRLRLLSSLFSLSLSLMLFAAIAYRSALLCHEYWLEGRTLKHLNIAAAPFHLFVPVGASLLCLEFASDIRRLVSREGNS